MITLIIKNTDGSPYWEAHFNTTEACDAWYATEQTRPYWDATRTHQIIDTTPAPITIDQIASLQAAQYLASTDWLVIRQIDSGIACPDDVKLLRAAARLKVIKP
jgi:hypothetical protein